MPVFKHFIMVAFLIKLCIKLDVLKLLILL